MKRWLLLLALSVLFYSMLLSPLTYAAGSIGFESFQFSSAKIYQGDSDVYVDLGIINNGNSSLVMHGAFVHFDWQATEENFMVGSQRSGEAWDIGKELAAAGRYTIRIDFSVPTSVIEGGHSFFFKVFYNDSSEAQWNPRAQDPFAELTVYNMWEPVYATLIISVEDKVAQAGGAGFISPEAKSLLQRAEGYLYDAYSYADQGKWQSAGARLQASSRYIDQAYDADQNFKTYLIVGGVIGIGAVIGAGLFIRRRRKRPSKSASEKAAKSSKVKQDE